MQLDAETLRFIFGFKLRGIRQEKDLSLKKLSQMTGMSPSYINEIEKGKKYPKGDKILILSKALDVSYDDLASVKLKRELGIIAQVLGNNMLRGIPFDVFGIPARTLFEWMAERPQNFSTLVGTILELARNYNITVEDFFHASLRAYLDSNNNYFVEIERSSNRIRTQLKGNLHQVRLMIDLLRKNHDVETEVIDFSSESDSISRLHSYYIAKNKRLLLNKNLSEKELNFVVAKELGFQHLGLGERAPSNLPTHIDSFETVLSNFKAAYFSSSLLIPREPLAREIATLLKYSVWDPQRFSDLIQSYPAPPSAFFHRLTQVLPEYFDLDQIFFLRFDYDVTLKRFQMLRELHLSELHAPHGLKDSSEYCRRWITVALTQEAFAHPGTLVPGIQRSQFFDSGKEYLCLSAAYPRELHPNHFESVTLGLKITPQLKKKVGFLNDAKIPLKTVGNTCRSCSVPHCNERIAPSVIPLESKDTEIEEALSTLTKRYRI